MLIRDAGCPDCRQISSDDCGKHGPVYYGMSDLTPLASRDTVPVMHAVMVETLEVQIARVLEKLSQILDKLDGIEEQLEEMSERMDELELPYASLQDE